MWKHIRGKVVYSATMMNEVVKNEHGVAPRIFNYNLCLGRFRGLLFYW